MAIRAADGTERLEGALKAFVRESPMLLGPFPGEVFVFVDSTVYTLNELSAPLLSWRRGTRDLQGVALPKVRRRGVSEDDYRIMLKDPAKAAAIAYNHSVPMLLERTASGHLAAVLYDVELVRDAFKGRFYITLIDLAQQRACVDIALPAPEDPPARLAIVGDTVLSIEQDVGVGDCAVTTVRRYVLRGERCAWVALAAVDKAP